MPRLENVSINMKHVLGRTPFVGNTFSLMAVCGVLILSIVKSNGAVMLIGQLWPYLGDWTVYFSSFLSMTATLMHLLMMRKFSMCLKA